MRLIIVVCTLILVQGILIAGGKVPEALPVRLYIVGGILAFIGGIFDMLELYWKVK